VHRECGTCEAVCTICADASEAEDDVRTLVRRIRLCHDCADACDDTLRILSRQTSGLRASHGSGA
jgi:hypothetical protein